MQGPPLQLQSRGVRAGRRGVNGMLAIVLTALLAWAAPAALGQDKPSYTELWDRGEYHAALEALNRDLAGAGRFGSRTRMLHRAELLFTVGRVEEAISELELFDLRSMEPRTLVALARYYKYLGRTIDYDATLQRARVLLSSRTRMWTGRSNFVEVGRLLEMLGTNPKTILSAHYEPMMEENPTYAPGYIAAGDLAYKHKGYEMAAKRYREALEIEPENQDALCGLAECYWKTFDGRLGETLDAIAELNPNHPRMRAIRVEKLLDAGRPDEALEKIDRAYEINPNALRFISLEAAARFLQYDEAGAQAAIDRALAINPLCSEAPRTVGRIASRRYRFKEGARFQKQALEVDPNDHEARALYAFDLLRLGREEEGRQHLERAFSADPYNVQVYNMLNLMDSLEDFATVERGPFRLQAPADEEPVLADDALTLLEEAAAVLQEKYQIDLETPILVQLFDAHDDFMVRSIGLPGNAGHLGICFGRLITMDSPSARAPKSMNWHSVLWHEFTHVVTLQKTHNRMPRWLSEGISVYEETERSPAWGQRLDPNFKAVLDTEELPGLVELEEYFSQPKTPGHLMLGYFLAGEFVGHYVERFGHDVLVRCLDLIAHETRADEALAEAAGTTIDDIESGFQKFLGERVACFDNLPPIKKAEDEEGPSILERLLSGGGDKASSAHAADAPFTNAMREGMKALEDDRLDDAERAFKEADRLYPEYAGSDAPEFQLARIYKMQNREDDYIVMLEHIVEERGTAFGACETLASIYQQKKRGEDLVRIAGKGLAIDPFDAGMQSALLEGQLMLKQYDNALDTLELLALLEPNKATDHRLRRARLFLELGRRDAAKRESLAVLEKTPHYWDAQELLLQVVEGEEAEAQEETDAS